MDVATLPSNPAFTNSALSTTFIRVEAHLALDNAGYSQTLCFLVTLATKNTQVGYGMEAKVTAQDVKILPNSVADAWLVPLALRWRVAFGVVASLALVFFLVWLAPPTHRFQGLVAYAPLHAAMETFAVAVSVLVFGVGWNSYAHQRNGNSTLLACAFLSVAVLDVAHFLSYAGMPDFITPSGPEKAIDFWFGARFAAVAGLTAVVLRSWHAPVSARTAYFWLVVALSYAFGVLYIVFYHFEWLPRTFIPGNGLTAFKIGVEWCLVAVLALSAGLLWWRRQTASEVYDPACLFVAIVVTIFSELCFTLYSSVTDAFNLLGHGYKIIAYVFIYRAVVVVNVRAPYFQLQRSEARYQRILESAPDAIISVGDDQRILSFNASAETLFGYRESEILGQPISALVPMSHRVHHGDWAREFFRGADQRLRMGGGRAVAGLRKDGSEVVIDVSLAKIEMHDAKVVVAMARDVTEQHRAEAEVRRLNAELESRVQARTAELATANKELESFSYSVSHDLRAPLRAIDGFSEVLLEDYGAHLNAAAKDYLVRIRNGTQRMDGLIAALLKLSRLTRLELHPVAVNLSSLVDNAVNELKAAAPERKVEVQIASDIMAHGDESLLQIAITNLIDNAWKYTSKNERALVEFGTELQEGKPAYYIRDNGVGFDMRAAAKLFGAFQRLHGRNEFPGDGIGLATVARIIHRHGGRVWAESAPGSGATFYFTLGS